MTGYILAPAAQRDLAAIRDYYLEWKKPVIESRVPSPITEAEAVKKTLLATNQRE